MNRQFGTKWFTFYSKVRPCIACLSVFTIVVEFVQDTEAYFSNLWLLSYFVASIMQPILCIIVLIKSFGNYVDFVRLVKVVLLIEPVCIAYQKSLELYVISYVKTRTAVAAFLIILLIGYFLWYRLNIAYFKKRINAVTGDSSVFATEEERPDIDNEQITTLSEPERICFCRKCGEKLLVGSKFCRKCGTEVVE